MQNGDIKHCRHYLDEGAECCSEDGTPFLDAPRHPNIAQTRTYHTLDTEIQHNHIIKEYFVSSSVKIEFTHPELCSPDHYH